MSESDGEHAARSVALEQAYVHEVYEQCAERTTQSRHWPRVYQFLQELEPGALVCDIGCGNGKYLSVNHSVFKIGVDRCKRFTDIAREKENEVLICDNLALPFREESFDAVLSIAVVHHFATTERRVHALKELARVLRIGGRLVISVWAMEQKHRKFESQDVLIPWPKSYCMSGGADGAKRSSASDGNEKRDDNAAPKHTSSSKKNSQRKCKSKSYWIDPIFSLSPSTSSLSSPNETCYSCFRRALQKLARSRRGGGAWFPGSWQGGAKSRRHCDSEDTTDVDELPIELRRVEITHTLTMTNKHSADTLSIKSKSLGDILEIERLDLVRSRSSIPGFCSTSELVLDERSVSSSSTSGSKPRLVKQRPCAEETVAPGNPEDTAIGNLIRDLPSFSRESSRRRNVPLKQSSMNEELMSAERLAEKERVRRNIMKQASLNEELICKWHTFEALKDTISPVNASRRFQLLKNGLTSKLKRSTTNIEKVSSISIKNGFVRMLQGWKSGENEPAPVATETTATPAKPADSKTQPVAVVKRSIEGVERRLSREDGSDSSKDSSLQSDTSVDSEDSFASVIYVPKPDAAAPPAAPATSEAPAAPRPAALQLAATSAPPSPRVKQPPENGPSSRYKVIGASPLLKQQPPANASTRFGETAKPGAEALENTPQNMSSRGLCPVPEPPSKPDAAEPDIAPLIRALNDVSKTREPAVASEDDNRRARLNQIKELLIAKPGFATRSRPSFPLVRRASTAASGRLETVTRILPRLLSLELFNPETDDLDSDSSGVSSPESVGSVISVTSDEKYIARREAEEKKNGARHEETARSGGDDATERTRETENAREDEPASVGAATLEDSSASPNPPREDPASFETETGEATHDAPKNNDPVLDAIRPASRLLLESGKTISAQSMKLLEAAANVASSLEDAVGAAIQRNGPTSTERQHSRIAQTRRNDDAWSSARAHLKHDRKSVDLTDRADESSSDLIRDISRYCQNSSFDIFGVHPESLETSSPSLGTADDNPAESDAAAVCWGDCDRAPKGTSWIVNEAYDEPGKHAVQPEPRSEAEVREDRSVPQPNCDKSRRESKYEIQLEDAAFRLNFQPGETARSNFDEPGSYSNFAYDGKETIVTSGDELRNGLGPQSGVDQERSAWSKPSPRNDTPTDDAYDDVLDFVVVSKTGECEDELKAAGGKWRASQDGLSADSSDVGDSLMENTTASPSDGSQAECSTARLFTGSTVSLVSNLNAENDRRTTAERRGGLQERGRSLDETSSEARRRDRPVTARRGAPDSLSNASSQESLPSDRGGGSITYHQYYHVFREGELDQLINKYVQNLHIISSYYDHASWCVVAEKVQVWTI